MLIDTIRQDLITATKAQDALSLKALRFILSEINYARIDKQRELTDEDVINVLQKEVKKRQEAITLMKKGGRLELIDEEEKKITVINKYMPAQISDDELEKIVAEITQANSGGQMGAVIGLVMQKVKGRADGKKVAQLVKMKLNPSS